MRSTEAIIDVSVRGAVACGLGLVMGVAQPALLPGVALMCLVILTFDL